MCNQKLIDEDGYTEDVIEDGEVMESEYALSFDHEDDEGGGSGMQEIKSVNQQEEATQDNKRMDA